MKNRKGIDRRAVEKVVEKENGVDELGKGLGWFVKEHPGNFVSPLELSKKLVW